ncbi:universal stress protein [Halococcus dombrowskii]|uniref:Universal stress protein n=1 Tax=Halococcus dombrowskii TaxID=179637 RepID=A0AAV3SIX7_HALDO|nr:universal stress protein [Halococcus dombrowskii]UOO93799.1 universal stress protein [Halococcus dombrowskii]
MTDVYDRILVPTDGSEPAAAAVRHALDLADRYDATLHALFVVDTDKSWMTVSKVEVHDALWEVGRETATRVLAEVEAVTADAGVELVTEILEGSPDRRIPEYAAENGIDLVVMGTHGRTGLQHRLLGSVTERVIRETTVPVMAVNAEASD